MKVLSINLGNYSSTGSIAQGIKQEAEKQGIEYALAYPFDPRNKPSQKDDWVIGNAFGRKCSIALGMMTGYNGCFSLFSTQRLLRRMKQYSPDIVHFHNLHNNYINLPLLFRYIKKNHIKVVWTLHDCWSFTGQCPYFDMAGCDKWKTGCHSCPSYTEYPKALVDNTKRMWRLKKKWFNGVEDLTIVTPSGWLAKMVKQSFMSDYPCQVIHNGIDLSVLKPTSGDWKERHSLSMKKVILGVAFDWGKRKGLDVFVKLAQRLPQDYQIVLIGTDETVKDQLCDAILAPGRTKSQQELAQMFTMADVFVNPTREEVLGLVNIEALACGTPGITFDVGGSPECYDETCGSVVPCDDLDALEAEIIRICDEKPYAQEACLLRAKEFDKNEKFKEYIKLYERIISTGVERNRA
mgnify:CR=1 FL=1